MTMISPTQRTLHQQHMQRRARFWPSHPPRYLRPEPTPAPAPGDTPPGPQPPAAPPRFFSLSRIALAQHIIAKEYGLTRADILGQYRQREIVRPRQIAIYIVKRLWKASLPEIGRRFGGRDHTTILHAIRTTQQRIDENEHLAQRVADLMATVAAEAAQPIQVFREVTR
jgi:Bacterial dnaA protein helix-turn-helix